MKKRPLKFMYLPTGGTELLIAGNLGHYFLNPELLK